MDVSVVICTYERAEYLKRTIQQVDGQDLISAEYEIIVVYTNGDSETVTVLRELQPDISRLRTVAETEGSLSNARNIGLQTARGDVIIYLDDDTLPDGDWLTELWRTFEEVEPTSVCVGGQVDPLFEGDKPSWLPEFAPGIPTCDLGPDPRWLDFPSEFIIGANMAFRSDFVEDNAVSKTTAALRGAGSIGLIPYRMVQFLSGRTSEAWFRFLFETLTRIGYAVEQWRFAVRGEDIWIRSG